MNIHCNKKTSMMLAVVISAMFCATTFSVMADDSDAATSQTFYYEVGDKYADNIFNGPYNMTWTGSVPGLTISNNNSGTIGKLYVSGTFTTAGTFVITAQTGATAVFVITEKSSGGSGGETSSGNTTTVTYEQNTTASGSICIGNHDLTWTGSIPGITLSMSNDYGAGLGAITYTGTFTTVGSYTITVSNGDTAIFIVKEPVTVDNIAPVASFVYSIDGMIVSFTDTSVAPTIWQWSFGDTTTSTAQNPEHTYSDAGTYEVALTVTNATTESNTYKLAITVGSLATATYTVTYDGNGGSGAETSISVTGGSIISLPSVTYSGHSFVGWYYNESFIGNAGSQYTVQGTISLTAHWSDSVIDTHTVTFIDGEKTICVQTIVDGGKATNVVLDGKYTWTHNDAAWNFNSVITEDLTLVAMHEADGFTSNLTDHAGEIAIVAAAIILIIAMLIGQIWLIVPAIIIAGLGALIQWVL